MSSFKFVDLFCGIGGFHQALSDLGGECVAACDIDAECRQTYSHNFGVMPLGDLTKISENDIPGHDVLCGGFPCQSFSKAGNRQGVNDPRGTLFFDIMRIAKHHQPKFMLLENVRNLIGHDAGQTWRVIRENITNIGYSISPEPIIFSPHYLGIPQHRERVFILCKRADIGSVPIVKFDKAKLPHSNALSILQKDEEIQDIYRYTLTDEQVGLIDIWGEFVKGIEGKMPGFPVWSDYLKMLDPAEDLDAYPAWKRNFILKNNELYERNKVFLDSWLVRARNHPLFFGSKSLFEWQAGIYAERDIWKTIMHFRPSGLRVKSPTHFPALVAITQTSIVGVRKRQLTPRECARLQSFPDHYKLNVIDKVSYKQLGNSVNVNVVKLFASILIFGTPYKHFNGLTIDDIKQIGTVV